MFALIAIVIVLGIVCTVMYMWGAQDKEAEAVGRGFGYYDPSTRKFFWGTEPRLKQIEALRIAHEKDKKYADERITELVEELDKLDTKHQELLREHRRCGSKRRR